MPTANFDHTSTNNDLAKVSSTFICLCVVLSCVKLCAVCWRYCEAKRTGVNQLSHAHRTIMAELTRERTVAGRARHVAPLLLLLAVMTPAGAFTSPLLGSRHLLRKPHLSAGAHQRLNGGDTRLTVGATALAMSSAAASQTPTDSFHLDYYNPNEIHPKTIPLTKSAVYFARFVVRMMHENRRRKQLFKLRRRLDQRKEVKPAWYRSLVRLNEQRRNLVALADYSASIVAPSFLFLILGALMTSVIPHYYAKCIQLVATLDTNKARLIQALAGLGISSTLCALFTGLRGSLFWIAGSRANYNIRVKLHRNLLLQEAAFYDSNETGYLLSRLNNDVNKIGQVISYHVNVVLRQAAQFLFGSVYLVKISPSLSVWAFVGIMLVAWVSAVYGAFNRKLAQKVQDTFADATAVAETSFSMSETIRAFDGVMVESGKYEAAQGRALGMEETQAWGYGTHKFVSDTLQSILQILLLFACWRVGMAGGLSAADLTAFMFYTNFVLESSNEVGDQWAKIQGAIGASSSVFDLIRRIPLVRDPPRQASSTIGTREPKSMVVNGGRGEPPIVQMNSVKLKYESMDVPALNGVSLDIHEGDRVAIVGRSGSGKSSMLRSILRFYDPTSGNIKLEGKDLSEMSRQELSAKLAVVEQEPALFPITLMENVLYGIEKDSTDTRTGKPCYSDEFRQKAEQALRIAGLPVRPGNDLNLELDTRVGEGGRALSGGQRQRVAIARALIRNPTVLLLDEPTSALDSASEKKVIEALRSAMEHSKCMVMVTHRLGAVRALDVNRVIVMDKGKIVESGHPERLLANSNGLYASLAREQGITAKIVSSN